MTLFKNIFRLLWRAWFYILFTVSILVMIPFLLVLTYKEKYYPTFWKLIRTWSKVLIYGMGFYVEKTIEQQIDRDKSYLFCANHASMLDPFILIAMSKNPIVFVGKKELVKIPVFGFFYKKVVIMVDRSNPKSRKRVYEMAKKRLQNGTSMGIFPEGLVPTEDVILSPFKNGAFSLAIEFQIPIVPATYYDCKRLFSWDFFKGSPGKFRVRQHEFLETKNLTKDDVETLKQQTFNILYKELTNDTAYMEDTMKATK
ncbi:MAG: lysophospholipid acyltransferase family protein [Polaribacter sp.]|nr:lysophospholipid acyltransferase family protein [Polaribacter sp.]